MNQIIKISKIVLVAALILWIVPRFFLQRVEPNQIGVRQSNMSGVLADDLAPGWHWRIPGIHKITDLPRRYIFLDYTDDSIGPQKNAH